MIELNPKVVEACIEGIKHIQDNIYKFNNTLYKYEKSSKINIRTYDLVFTEYSRPYNKVICKGGSNSASTIRYDGFNECKVRLTEKAREIIRVIQQTYYYEQGRKVRRAKEISTRKKIKCPICGKMFTPKNGRKYCSNECLKVANIQKAKENNPIKTYHRICPVCGKPFIAHHDGNRYCSAKCRIKRNNDCVSVKKKRETYSVKKCLNCGKEFYGSPRMVHCCSSCREEYAHKRILERRKEAKINLVNTSK